jgi:hypothetical protein
MAKLILTNEVQGLGTAGDVVDVKNGYARNFLIPQGFRGCVEQRWTEAGRPDLLLHTRPLAHRSLNWHFIQIHTYVNVKF